MLPWVDGDCSQNLESVSVNQKILQTGLTELQPCPTLNISALNHLMRSVWLCQQYDGAHQLTNLILFVFVFTLHGPVSEHNQHICGQYQ